MSKEKQQIRDHFRNGVFMRDHYRCKVCQETAVDAHHITDRKEMPAGGYVHSNGIALCEKCHLEAEKWHNGNKNPKMKYSPEKLYQMIGSSKQIAVEDSKRLEK